MCRLQSLLYLGVLIVMVVANNMLDQCLKTKPKYIMNVVLLEDNTYEWSRPFVQAAVEEAIAVDREENIKYGTNWRWHKTQANGFTVKCSWLFKKKKS